MDALLRRRQMMLAGGGSPTPPTPTWLVFYDRLIFDGTAYIETDIIPDSNDSYRVTLGNETQKKAQRYFLLATENSGFTGVFLGSSTNSTKRYFSVYYGSTSTKATPTMNFSTTETTVWLTPHKFGYGSTATSTFTKGSNAPSGPLVIGQSPSGVGQPFTGRMGWFRVYGSDAENCAKSTDFDSYTPKYFLRPCTYNGEAGLWCEETRKFYGNSAGSGTLTVLNNS